MTNEKDYVLGTHDDEIERLGLQHRIWRPRAADAWRRAGITQGQRVLDVGCGPGYATIDMAEIVGPEGNVHAIDRSARFLHYLHQRLDQEHLNNVTTYEQDLDESVIPVLEMDAAWSRWVFSFVKKPKELLRSISQALKPGGRIIIHEYFHYNTLGLAPRLEEFEEFVRVVSKSWRDNGGEPNIGLELPGWLIEFGFRLVSVRPIIDVIPPNNFLWQWPKSFLKINLTRLSELGYLSSAQSEQILEKFLERERDPSTLMITPAVLEIIAER